MEIFKNKFLFKLIASICLVLTLFNFAGASKVFAAGDDDELEGWGGILIKPVMTFFTGVGDAIMEILHDSIQSQDVAIIKVNGDSTFWETVKGFFAIVVGALITVGAIWGMIASGGALAITAAVVSAGVVVGSGFSVVYNVGNGALTIVGSIFGQGWIPNDIYLPAFSITAEEIFSNELALFDVDFFNINNVDYGTYVEKYDDVVENSQWSEKVIINGSESSDSGKTETFVYTDWLAYFQQNFREEQVAGREGETVLLNRVYNDFILGYLPNEVKSNLGNYKVIMTTYPMQSGTEDINDPNPFKYYCGLKICDFSDVEVVNIYYEYTFTKAGSVIMKERVVQRESTADQLRGIIQTWYAILRIVALLVLMLVLIYSGIRIVLGSTAGEKAKYKERLMDWLVAICLVFVMHYIMVFAVKLVSEFNNLIGSASGGNFAIIELTDNQADNAEKVLGEYLQKSETETDSTKKMATITEENGVKRLTWMTDLAGLFRIQSQMYDKGTTQWVGYSFVYLVLVLFTLFFAWTYLRRIVYMAFLTMIAPLVAMTYPIDKLTDGKAQAFNSWLKEYIFNLMIQPLHLLLYTILVSSAYELVSENPIYAIVAVWFMMPAEKLLRKFFGFDKAQTPGLLGGAAGAAFAMAGIQRLGKGKSKGGKSGGSDEGKSKDKNMPKLRNKSNIDAWAAIRDQTDSATGEPQPVGGVQPAGKPQTGGSNVHKSRLEQMRIMLADQEERNARAKQLKPQELPGGLPGGSSVQAQRARQMKIMLADQAERNAKAKQLEASKKVQQGNNKNLAKTPKTIRRAKLASPQPKTNINTPTPKTNVPTNNEPVQTPKKYKGNILSAGASAIGKQMKRDFGGAWDQVKSHPLKFAGDLAKGAARLEGTLAGATLGAAIATAGGEDATKMVQDMAIGGAAGGALAGAVVDDIHFSNEMIEDYEKAYYGENYAEHVIEERRKAFRENEEYIKYLMLAMPELKSEEEAQEIIDTTGLECFDQGIENIEDVASIERAKRRKNMTTNQAITACKDAKNYVSSSSSRITSKKEGEVYNTFVNDGIQEGLNREAVEKESRLRTERLKEFISIRGGLGQQ